MQHIHAWWAKGKHIVYGLDTRDVNAVAKSRAIRAVERAKWRGFWRHFYQIINSLFQLHPNDFIAVLRLIIKWGLLGGITGVLAGSASAIFLIALEWATNMRLEYSWLLWWLPVAGFLMGWVYYNFAGAAAQGSNLVIDEVNQNRSRIPLRMAPLVLLGTVVTHLFGGSAGREGTAIQMGASLADGVQRLLRLGSAERRMMIMAGISGGFGSVFGVPVAGAVFGMEVQSVGRIHYEGIIPCLVASYVGDLVTRAWGVSHTHYPQLAIIPIEPWLLLMVITAGSAFGLTSLVFVELIHGIKRLMALFVHWTPLRPLLGGLAIIALTLMVGTRDYLGLSLPLIEQSLDGTGVVSTAFLLKLVFTAVTLGTGYLGGEVTPLFVIGSTLGYTLGTFLGVDPTFLAAIGLVAIFAGASNTPLACTIMGIELFGGGATLYLFLGCVVAYLASGHRGIYGTQLVGIPKASSVEVLDGENLYDLIERRQQGWLPNLAHLTSTLLQKPVSTFMITPILTVPHDALVPHLVSTVLESGVRSIPVIDSQRHVVGIVTDRDLQRSGVDITLSLLRQMTPQERSDVMAVLAQSRVQEVMSRPVTTLKVTATLQEAIELFAQQELKRLPVVNDQGRLMGIVTRSDLLREIAFADSSTPANPDVKTTLLVKDVQYQPAVTVMPTTPLIEAIQAMRVAGQMRSVATDATGRIIGILTTTDLMARVPASERSALLAALAGKAEVNMAALSQDVADVMTVPVVTVLPENTVMDALRLLLQQGIKHLPVVDEQGHLLGLIGRARLFHALYDIPVTTTPIAMELKDDNLTLAS